MTLHKHSKAHHRYAVSEGPTKVDFGENDDVVLPRTPEEKSKWVNPLSVMDTGHDDESVVLQLTDGSNVKVDPKTNMVQRKRRIYDADGDGVEDNVEKTYDELDRFYIPFVFGPAEEMHNTHHGNLPGHVRLEEHEGEPTSFVQRLKF